MRQWIRRSPASGVRSSGTRRLFRRGSRLAQLQKSARDGEVEAAQLRTEGAAARARLKAIQKELDAGEQKNGDLADAASRAATAVDDQRKETSALDGRVRDAIAGLFVD